MQTNLLSTQSTSGINNGNAPARNASNGSDGSQFGAMLSHQMVERQAALPLPPASAPAPAPKADAPKPQAADKPARHDDAPPASSSTQTAKADASESTDDADADQAKDEGAAKADPAAEMLALMASLQQPGQDAAGTAKGKASAASQAFDALGGGKTRRGDAQLAALQAAMKSVSKESGSDAAGASGKVFSAATVKNPALAAAGADLGLDTGKATAADGADLRTALDAAAAAVKGEAKPQLDSADLVLRQARDAALQATAQVDTSPVATALAQPAMLEAAEAAAAASESLSARVGTSQWENQVGQKVVYMVGSEEQTASLTLNPPDLGPLQVVLSVSNDQASVTFSANQEEVRQALENALPRLREMMSESGIALGNASVNAGMPDGRQAPDQQAPSSRGFGRTAGRGDDRVGGVDDAAARPVTRTVTLGDRGMVDTFA
ncbi:flagellar hook-length control protein FliK [Herbaspirillum sp. SJZ107]|uniref:flagellar hook-length control protein FliK n=1 Tax=Herbaspirillum sp. SJZ107 TaxID=2572881 RepID=UPI001153E838|nr:flagellar hook-length control protein FliK [Herbaspirillum sp. SJZ107]TQK07521.1 flagellar hook-length control protein FliK [Herbaspirillum sp. SJZ107]